MVTPSYAISAWLFTRALSLIYVIAFTSLLVQARGLWGSGGILPIQPYLQAVERQVEKPFWELPTVFWLSSSDGALVGVAALGVLAAAVAFAGVLQGPMLLLCFLLYLSFSNAGQEFLSFQWDALLLEVGFVALFAVPWSLRPGFFTAIEPHWSVRFLFYVVLFKLMFLSGVVKLLSGDTSWRDMSALTYHYWTQPLPNPLSPLFHALPKFVHQFSTVMTFVVELAIPFLIFWPRFRAVAAVAFAALSLLILVSGNYTFFNWLTLALCVWLLPDSFWSSLLERLPFVSPVSSSLPLPFASALVPMSILALISLLWCTRWMMSDNVLTAVMPVLRVAQQLHVSSSYGLFATMTKSRPEIVIEGSLDGMEWREYEFKYKPGGLYRRPPVVAPHQPRLDWQMWFAALGSFRQNPWVGNLMARLFSASPEVLSFFSWNPFPEEPPRYLRARLYEYHFESPGTILREGKWWRRELLGDYSPTFERQ